MTELAQTLSRGSVTDVGTRTFKLIVIFCGVGLSVSLLVATYGLDLSPGLF